ncbi:PREDICTED: SRC kinase signaling inhibitor 1-like, partial [Cyprinodon variegatus]|uniref:SRC kinase signaling inhibitor 1-like n=1 Tax=Cyprinodon variegatus TaxID=28743 RepID=UPI000742B290
MPKGRRSIPVLPSASHMLTKLRQKLGYGCSQRKGISLDQERKQTRDKRKDSMISAGDAEFPRDYHTLAASGGRGARRFPDNSNGGFTSSSLDRRHNSVAAKSLEALNSIHKADIERQRDALMDLQKNKYTNSPGSLSQGPAAAGRQ